MKDERPDPYRLPYVKLFNGVTDALRMLEQCNYGAAWDNLVKAQQEAEEAYIAGVSQEPE